MALKQALVPGCKELHTCDVHCAHISFCTPPPPKKKKKKKKIKTPSNASPTSTISNHYLPFNHQSFHDTKDEIGDLANI